MAGESSERVLSGLDAGRHRLRAEADGARHREGLRCRRRTDRESDGRGRARRCASWPQAQPTRDPVATSTFQNRYSVLVVGVSTGGPQGLKSVIARLPADFPIPVAVVLHMPIGYTEAYAKRLDELSALTVVEARDGEEFRPGVVLVAPAGRHLKFHREADGRVIDAARRPAARYAAPPVGGCLVPIRRRRLRRPRAGRRDDAAWVRMAATARRGSRPAAATC